MEDFSNYIWEVEISLYKILSLNLHRHIKIRDKYTDMSVSLLLPYIYFDRLFSFT